jgi:hypothetical protein
MIDFFKNLIEVTDEKGKKILIEIDIEENVRRIYCLNINSE